MGRLPRRDRLKALDGRSFGQGNRAPIDRKAPLPRNRHLPSYDVQGRPCEGLRSNLANHE